MRWMVVVLGLAGPSLGQTIDGNVLHTACSSGVSEMAGYCAGYVVGVSEGMRLGTAFPMIVAGQMDMAKVNTISDAILLYCLEDSVQNSQLIDVFRAYLRDHPEKRHQPARSLLLMSLQEAFPCRAP